jgi:hypothetical protein
MAPPCARHGALKGQLDPSAWLIWTSEKMRLAWDVHWPDKEQDQPASITRLLANARASASRAQRER